MGLELLQDGVNVAVAFRRLAQMPVFWAGRLPGAVQDVLALAPEDRRLVVLAPQASGRLSVSYI